ncbi:hypothetical protein Tco_0682879 [Tanacetum coccineum]|uniref:Uncharacterized protein n=1 Tax=Tanacetum coccineum TaxID=301880 RepID=A0ABQ4XSF3_9ASTR
MPKTVDEMLKRVDDYIRSKEAFRDTKLPKGEFQRRETINNQGQRNDQMHKSPYGNNRHRMYYMISYRAQELCVPYVLPYRPPPDLHRNNNIPRDNKIILTLESLISTLKEILATEYQLRLPYIALPESIYCDNHGEKGHNTNDCYHLRTQLEAALESGKLNHLVKDIRQKGKKGIEGERCPES